MSRLSPVAALRVSIVVLGFTVVPWGVDGAFAAEIPLATSLAAEMTDPLGVPFVALDGGVTAGAWLADGGSVRLKMQWLSAAGQPLFETDGREIAVGGGEITSVSILRRPGGGAFVAYGERQDSGDEFLFAQAFDAAGSPLWPGDGVRVSDIEDSQSDVSLVPDFVGGVYACLSLERGQAIRCQHLDRDGDRLWTESGHDVGGGPGPKVRAKTVSDGAEGVMVFWHNLGSPDAAAGPGEEETGPMRRAVEGQHFNSPGAALWGEGVHVVDLADSAPTDLELEAIADGEGGAFVVFDADRVPGAEDVDVFMQRISSLGKLLWEDRRAVTSGPSEMRLRGLAPAADGFIAIVADLRGEFYRDLRLFRLDADGFHLWGDAGQPLSTTSPFVFKTAPRASFDAGVLRVAWTEQSSPESSELDIFIARFAADGSRLGDTEVVTSVADDQWCRSLIYHAGSARVVVLWEDLRKGGGDVDIYASETALPLVFASGFELGNFDDWDAVVTP